MATKRPSEQLAEGGPAKLAKTVAIKAEGRADAVNVAAGDDIHRHARGGQYPIVMYKDTEPLQGLQDIYDAPGDGDKVAEVLIPSEYIANSNRRVKTRQLWGDEVYTGDSDVVAALMHLGYFPHYLPAAPTQAQELHALLRLLPPRDAYPSKARFIRSRAWNSIIQGCSFQVEACWLITRSGTTVDLQPSVADVPAPYPTVNASPSRPQSTRSTGRGVKVSQEVSVQYNLCNEPWLKYTLPAIADRGLKPAHWTSARLLRSVLLMETDAQRFQLHRAAAAAQPLTGSEPAKDTTEPPRDVYTLSCCRRALPSGVLASAGLPLCAPEHVEVLEEGLSWEELRWGVNGLVVRERMLPLRRLHFFPMAKARGEGA